jgi:ribosomal protein S18 acetylase RimI-like enzyme
MAVVRQVRSTEGARFRAIRLQAIEDSPSAFGSTLAETEARPMTYWHDRVAQAAAGEESVLFVAEDDTTWVGIVGGFLGETEGMKSVALISMWVDPAYRGQGLGRQLVERIITWAQHHGARHVELWVTEQNDPAISLYIRCGFQTTGETQQLPSNPDLLEQRMILDL